MSEPAPGWFPDPNDPQIQRYWTGTQWGDRRMWNGTEWAPSPPFAPPDAVPASGWSPQPATQSPTGAAGYGPVPMRYAAFVPGKKQTMLLVLAAGITIAGCLLPWATQTSEFGSASLDGTSANGGVILIVLALVVVALAAMYSRAMLGRKSLAANLVLGLLAVTVAVINVATIKDTVEKQSSISFPGDLGSVSDSVDTSVGVGLIIALVGTIMMVVTAVLALGASRRPL